ncbi:MAG TPA: SPOR domain-containing protein [Steroidobacteraceae bacterium]|nr:SPOR domain-containing protein [Steroidobacteraceae bacterium]
MERKVKERLVGAAVLMAAAVLLIPEMLSGHRESTTEPAAAQSRNDAPIKTYTIDLSHSSSEQPPTAVVENRAPPPEEAAAEQPSAVQPAAGDQAKPEVPQQSAAVQPDPQPAAQAPKPAVVEQPTAAASSARAPLHPLASGEDAPTSAMSGRWAVQVGTFSKEANAQRLVKQLRDQGQSAFVMPLKSGGATLYRVRIGPMKDRASADAALRELKSAGAKVVSHP